MRLAADHQPEPLCKERLQHEFGRLRRSAAGNFADDVIDVEYEPGWPVGDHIFGDAISRLNERQKTCVANDVLVIDDAAGVVRFVIPDEPALGGAGMNVRQFEFRLLGKQGHCDQRQYQQFHARTPDFRF